MRRKGSECTRISPESTSSEKPMISSAPSSGRRAAPRARAACGSARLLRSARCSAAAKFYRRVRASLARALRRVSRRGGSGDAAAVSERNVGKQRCAAQPDDDCRQSEAVEECIRFMNSSSKKYR